MKEEATGDITGIALAATLMVALLATFIIYFIVRFRHRQMVHVKEKEQMLVKFDGDVIRARLEISEQTLEKISQEIHDNIGQLLTLAKLQYGSATQETFDSHFRAGNKLVSQAIGDLRNLVRSLNGNFILENGLVPSIVRELNLIAESGSITTQFIHHGEYPDLNAEQEFIFFRCIQEALNNAVKHSACSQIEVDVEQTIQSLEIKVTDNGNGMPAIVHRGIGLTSMQERMKILGGLCLLLSNDQGGTTVKFSIPFRTADS